MSNRLSPFYPSFHPFAVPANKIRLDTTPRPEPDLGLVAELLSIEKQMECTPEVHEAEVEEHLNNFFAPFTG